MVEVMRNNVLFEITKDVLDTGLQGVPVGYCATSFVDPLKGPIYVGRPIAELSHKDPVEIIYLLYYGEAGTKEQIAQFQSVLNQRASCQNDTLKSIAALPTSGQPMDALAASLLIVGMREGTGHYREDCLNVIAKLPQIAAAVINHHAGWGETVPSQPELGYIENFVHMLGMKEKKTPELIRAMKLFNILYLDHCGGDLPVFVGKSVASGLENLYGSIAASMTALAGVRYAYASQGCVELIQQVLAQVGEHGAVSELGKRIQQKLQNNQRICGFGHSVLRVEDPRATICYDYCKKHFSAHPLVNIAFLLRTEGSRILKEHSKISNPHPNVDAISGSMLMAAGFTYPEYFTILAGLARCVGIAIQIVYERLEVRGGKGTPMMRPLYLYKSRK